MPHALNAVVVAASVATLVGTLLAVAALAGLRRVFPRAHMVAWSWSWLAAVVRDLGSLLFALGPLRGPTGSAVRMALLLAFYLQAAWLLVGAYEFMRSTGPPARLRRLAVGAPVLLALGSALALALGIGPRASVGLRLVLPALALAAASLGAAWLVSRRRPEPPAVGDRLLGGALALYGTLRAGQAGAHLFWLATGRLPAPAVYLGFADFLVLGVLVLGTVVCLLEDEHRLVLRAIRERGESERALLEERGRLRLSEEKFAKAVRSGPDAVTISSLKDGRFLDVGGGFERILGYTASEVLGRTSREVGIWAEPTDRVQIVRALEEEGRVSDLEILYKTKSGELRMCSVSAERIQVEGEDCLIAIARDITERKKAERALAQSEERFSKVFRSSPDSISISSLDGGRYLDVNEAFERTFGYPRAEVLGRSALEIGIWADPDERAEWVERLRTHGGARDVPVMLRTKSGERRVCSLAAEVIHLGDGDYIVTTARDMTDWLAAEARLRDSEERLRRISEAAFEGIGFAENGIIVDANPQLAAMLGYTVSELVGRPVTDFVATVDSDRVQETLRGTGPSAYEHQAIRKDGSTLLVEVQDRPVEQAGRELRVTAIRDISERARLEAALQRSETLSAVGALVTGVAHEVRTPLFSISATLDAYESQLADAQERGEFMALLRSQVKRLTNLMTDLLDYAKPPALRLVRGDIAPVIHRAVRSCAAAAADAGVEVAEEIAAEPAEVERDEGRLEQVFQNLLANAVQLSPRGSTVRMAVRPVPGGVACAVLDQGPGLREGDADRVFEPFFTRRKGGTGLGLSIVRRIVEEHGGTVVAANRPEGGAVFTVRLPAAAARAAPEAG